MFGASLEIGKRWNAAFHDPNKKLAELMPQLLKMKNRIQDAMAVSDPLEGIVMFFNAVNPVFDNVKEITETIDAFEAANYGDRHKEAIKGLTNLRSHVRNAGRNRSGMNRTKAGELTTPHNVFLGDIWGLFTHPVHFWMTRDPEEKTKCPNGRTAIENIRWQAGDFIEGHLPMTSIIEKLNSRS